MKQMMEIKQRNPLDWYSLTESANSILNGLVALTSREKRLELKKPDRQRVAKLNTIGDDALNLLGDAGNFMSLEKMEAIIDKYSPVLLAEKKKLQTATGLL